MAVVDDMGLSHIAKSAAVPIWRHARHRDGHNCRVGRTRAAAEIGIGISTLRAGWRELEEMGYLRRLSGGGTSPDLKVITRPGPGHKKAVKYSVGLHGSKWAKSYRLMDGEPLDQGLIDFISSGSKSDGIDLNNLPEDWMKFYGVQRATVD